MTLSKANADLLQGTLDLLVLRTLLSGPQHGWGISQRIQQTSEDGFRVNQGSLYPALHRLEADRHLGAAKPRAEARRTALLTFGGMDGVKEECRDTRGVRFLETLFQDLRYGARSLRKNPGFSAVVVLTLALGIGANTAVFSVVRGVLLRPLPYAQGEQLVALRQPDAKVGIEDIGFSVKEVQDYREQARSLDGLVEYHSMNFTLLGGQEPQRVQTGVVSAAFFDVLGVKPLLGRTFRAGE